MTCSARRAVDELVAERGLRTPFARMAAEGTVLSPSLFTGVGRLRRRDRRPARFVEGAGAVRRRRDARPAGSAPHLGADRGFHPAAGFGSGAPRPGQRVHHSGVLARVRPALRHARRVRHPDRRREALDDPRAGASASARRPAVDGPPRCRRRTRTNSAPDRRGLRAGRRALPAARMDPLRGGAGRHVHPSDDRRPSRDAARSARAAAGTRGRRRRAAHPLPLGVDYSNPSSLDADLAATIAAAHDLLDAASELARSPQRCSGHSTRRSAPRRCGPSRRSI